jgi:hypothetical protein
MTAREIIAGRAKGEIYAVATPPPYVTGEAQLIDEGAGRIEADARATARQYASAAAASSDADARAKAEIASIHIRNAETAESLVKVSDIEAALGNANEWFIESMAAAMTSFSARESSEGPEAARAWWRQERDRIQNQHEERITAALDTLAAKARLAAWIEAAEDLAIIDKPLSASPTVASSASH